MQRLRPPTRRRATPPLDDPHASHSLRSPPRPPGEPARHAGGPPTGDTLELKYGDSAGSQRQKSAFDAEIATWGVQTHIITGNHDPEISSLHHLLLRESRVFVTHGDAIFRNITPWSSSAPKLRHAADQLGFDGSESGPPERLSAYLELYKRASSMAHKLESTYNPSLWGKTKIFLHQAWPPTRPFKILRSWRQAPDRAVSLASRFSLQPDFIVIGHTHQPGIWRRGPQTVINLGSFFPWPGALCVDIVGDELIVRSIAKRQPRVAIGQVVARFPLSTIPNPIPEPLPSLAPSPSLRPR